MYYGFFCHIIKCFFPAIAAKLLDVLPSHTIPEQVSTEPMAATVRAEMVPQVGRRLGYAGPHTRLLQPRYYICRSC